MAKKSRKGGGGGRKRHTRRQRATLHITSLVGIAFLLWKMGLLDGIFWSYLQTGNLQGMVSSVQNAVAQNFATVSGAINTAIQGGALAVAIALIRKAVKGGIPMGRKIGAIGA